MKRIYSILFLILLTSQLLYAANQVIISAIQMSTKQQTYQQFIKTVAELSKGAKSQGAEIILFPEDNTLNMINDSEFKLEDLKSISKYAKPYAKFIGELSKKLDVILVGGTIPYIREGKLYNTAIIGLPDGKVIYHDKIYLTPWEVEIGYDGSGNEITVFNTKWGKVALVICYSSEFPDVSLTFAEISPNIVLVPSYTDDLYGLSRVTTAAKMRSIENFSYTVLTGMVSNLSRENLGEHEVAQAIFATPQEQGFPLYQLKLGKFNQEDIVTQTLDIEKLETLKEKNHAFPNKDSIHLHKNISIKTYDLNE